MTFEIEDGGYIAGPRATRSHVEHRDRAAYVTVYPFHGDAACAGMGDVFFQERQGPITDKDRLVAVCQGCQIREQCIDWGTAHDEYGVWGGLTQQERRRLKRWGYR